MLIGGSLYRSEMEPWTSSWLAALEGIEENSSRPSCEKRKMYKVCKYSYRNHLLLIQTLLKLPLLAGEGS